METSEPSRPGPLYCVACTPSDKEEEGNPSTDGGHHGGGGGGGGGGRCAHDPSNGESNGYVRPEWIVDGRVGVRK